MVTFLVISCIWLILVCFAEQLGALMEVALYGILKPGALPRSSGIKIVLLQ